MTLSNKLFTHAFIILFLSAASFIIYHEVGNYDFINLDDDIYVWANPYTQKGLTADGIEWAFSLSKTVDSWTYWHPLTSLSHMLDCQLFGLNAGKHHLVNLFIHIINAALLYIVFYQMTGAIWRSAFVAILFAIHPLNVDSVAWIAERKNLLSTFFWILTMLAYVRYAVKPTTIRYLTIFITMAAGLLAKPMLVTLPCVLLLIDFWPMRRLRLSFVPISTSVNRSFQPAPLSRLVLEKLPLLALSGLSIFFSIVSLNHHNAIITHETAALSLRIENALVSYVKYIAKIFIPQNMAIYYPFPEAIPIWQVFGAATLLSFAFITVIILLKKAPYMAMGWLWFTGTLLPVIGIIQGGIWPEMADRWTYVPAIGIFIMISWGSTAVVKKFKIPQAVSAILIILLTVYLILIARAQSNVWQNSITLFSHSLDVAEANHFIHYNLAETYARKGNKDEAIKHFKQALILNPQLARAHNNLGNILAQTNHPDEAIKHYFLALEINPNMLKTRLNLGKVLLNSGKLNKAIEQFRLCLKIDPENFKIYELLGKALARNKSFDEAIVSFKKAISLNPKSADAFNSMGGALAEKGEINKALEAFNKALSINPDFPHVHNNMGNVLMQQGRLEEALYHYEKLISGGVEKQDSLTNKNRDMLISLLTPDQRINVYFKTAIRFTGEKNFHKAIEMFQRILAIAPNNSTIYYNISCLYSIQHRNADAINWLRQAVAHGYDNWEGLKNDPDMKNIIEEPYVRELIK